MFLNRIVLAYSGDVATTAAIPWLMETRRADVIAVTVDLGQAHDLESVRDRALAAGAVRAHVLDKRDEFARAFLLPALQAGALGDPGAEAALVAPLVAKALIEIATIEQAPTMAHGATGAGRARLDAALAVLDPAATVAAPAHEWRMTRAEQLEYLRVHHVVSAAEAELEDGRPALRSPAGHPAEPAHVGIAFDRGAPVAINNIDMELADLLATLGTIAAANGVGTPPVVMLQTARRELQALATSGEVDRVARDVAREYALIISAGEWFGPLRPALDAFVGTVRQRVTGSVRIMLRQGTIETAAVLEHGRTVLTVVGG